MKMRSEYLVLRRKLPTAWACSNFRRAGFGGLPLFAVIMAGLLASSSVSAQTAQTQPVPTPTPTPSPPPASATTDHRAFDFWIGIWDVTPAGRDVPIGKNIITADHAGCVIREDYATKGGYTGMSMSFYDAARKSWHQTWMGADGSALYIEGGLNDAGQMVLSNANTPYYVKGTPINRITWTPNADGSVRQHWQASQDGGKTWSDVFNGLYVKNTDGANHP